MKQENKKFNFFVPFEIDTEKGEKLDSEGLPEDLIVSGVISTGDEDADGQRLNPNGAILDDFVKRGLITMEHKSRESTSYIVGEPVECFVKDNKVWLKGRLYKSNPKAREIYQTALMLEKEGSNRRLGYSIEGKILKLNASDSSKVDRYKISAVTITATPKNTNTYLSIVKGEYAEAYIEPEFDETANGGAEYLLDVTRPDGTRVTIDKEFNIKIDKAMSAGSVTGTETTGKDTNGASLKRESLKRKLVNLQPDFIKAIIEISKGVNKFSDKQKNILSKRIKSLGD